MKPRKCCTIPRYIGILDRSAYVFEGNPIEIPYHCKQVDFEVELGVVIGSKLKDASVGHNALRTLRMGVLRTLRRKALNEYGVPPQVEQVEESISGYTVCIDMTARDIQKVFKDKRLVTPSPKLLLFPLPIKLSIFKSRILLLRYDRVYCVI